MWVEADRDPRGRDQGREPTQRVLLGLTFTNLGETRLGITRTGPAMKVRVWTEHPERLEPSRTDMEGELRELGADLQILPLAPGPEGAIPSRAAWWAEVPCKPWGSGKSNGQRAPAHSTHGPPGRPSSDRKRLEVRLTAHGFNPY